MCFWNYILYYNGDIIYTSDYEYGSYELAREAAEDHITDLIENMDEYADAVSDDFDIDCDREE